MKTKKGIMKEKFEAELAQYSQQLKEAEKLHQCFQAEDKMYEEYQIIKVGLIVKREAMLERCYEGNWGNRDNWFFSRIPTHFKQMYLETERRIMVDALTEISDENYLRIINSEEFKQIENEIIMLKEVVKTSEHIEVEYNIQKFQDKIGRLENSIKNLDDMKILREICTIERRIEEANKITIQNKIRLDKYKEMIRAFECSQTLNVKED